MTDQTQITVRAKRSRKPSNKQRKAAVAVVENAASAQPRTNAEVLASVGYGTIVQDPKRILESPGFKLALKELGLTPSLVTASLVHDIHKKPKKRYHELKLAAEILGMVKKGPEEPPKSPHTATYNFIFAGDTQAAIQAINAQIKAKLLQKHETTPQS